MAESTPNATGLAGLAIPETKPAAPVTPDPNAAPVTVPKVEPPVVVAPPPNIVSAEDFKRFSAEVDSTGDLSKETYDALAAKGLPNDVVKSYVDNQKARNEAQLNQLFSEVGGKDEFVKLQTWASAKLSEPQKQAFNKTLKSGDTGAIQLALRGIKAAYTTEFGNSPNLTSGGISTGGPVAFASMRDYIDAKKAPAFQTSPGYRASVEARLAVSTFYK